MQWYRCIVSRIAVAMASMPNMVVVSCHAFAHEEVLLKSIAVGSVFNALIITVATEPSMLSVHMG